MVGMPALLLFSNLLRKIIKIYRQMTTSNEYGPLVLSNSIDYLNVAHY